MKKTTLLISFLSLLNAGWDQSLDRWEMDCNYNNASACSIAASMYEKGERVVFENGVNLTRVMKKNPPKALKLYKKACKLGDKLACKKAEKINKKFAKNNLKKKKYEFNKKSLNYLLKKDYQKALIYINKALSISKNNNFHPKDLIGDIENKGIIYIELNRCQEAEKLFKEAMEIIQKNNIKEMYASNLNYLGRALACEKKFKEAEDSFKKSREILKKSYGINYPYRGIVTENLAETYFKEGNYKESEKYYKEALKIYQKSLGKKHNNAKRVIKSLIKLSQKTNNQTNAKKLQKTLEGLNKN